MTEKKTLVLGASEKPWRYSYMAAQLLKSKGHPVEAIGLSKGKMGDIHIQTGKPELRDVHTVTMYVAPEHQPALYDYIFSLNPRRIIFNPGTENAELEQLAAEKGIEVEEACTLVMLRTGQF
jgi:predicted CoA-binding protein